MVDRRPSENTGNLTAEWLDHYKLVITIYTAQSRTESGEQIALDGFRVNLRHKISNRDNCIFDVLYGKDNNNKHNKIFSALKLSPVAFTYNSYIHLGIQDDWVKTKDPAVAEQLRQFEWTIAGCFDCTLRQTATPEFLSTLQDTLNEFI